MRIARCLLAFAFAAMALLAAPSGRWALAEGIAPAAPADTEAVAGSVTVTIPGDQWSPPNNTNTQCSFREALEQAAGIVGGRGCKLVPANADVVTIKFTTPGTYVLSLPDELPYIGPSGRTVIIDNDDIVIDGNMSAGRATGIFRIAGGILKLIDVTLQHGSRPFGGAVYIASGTLIAEHVTFKQNGLRSGANATNNGGAISVDTGTLLVNESLFQDNQAVHGGGAFEGSFGIFTKTKFIGNKAWAGGAVQIENYTTNPVEFIESEFRNNLAERTSSLPNDYEVADDTHSGGAIQNLGHLRLYRTLITENKTARVRGGGGLSNEAAGKAVLEECVFSKNQATIQQSSSDQWSWGGAIFNGGQMDVIRCSIHGNFADTVAGIFNAYAGDLQLFNTTISNNTAKYNYGSLANGHAIFALGNTAAQIRMFHTTIGPNSGGNGNTTNWVHSKQNHQMWFANSVLDVGCVGDQYTYGRSVMRLNCFTEVDPQNGFDIYTDSPNTDPGFLPLTSGSLPVQQFMVQPLNAQSAALNIGRDDTFGCSHPLIDQKDANLADRGAGDELCDAGAWEGGSLKPVYTSNPTTGLIQFPIVSFLGGPGESTVNLGLSNSGGGALEFKAVLEDSPAITMLTAPTGVLFQNGSTNLVFRCNPPGVNDYWANLEITSNGSNKKRAQYKLRCTGAGEGPQASSSEEPGPVNLPPTEPGHTANGTLVMSNNGTQPLNVNGSYKTAGGPFGSSGLLGPDQGSAPEGGPWTLQPGQSVTIHLTCTPPAFGVFVNTFQVTTNDTFHPTLKFPIGCEGLVTSPTEDWQPGGYASTSSALAGVAVSHDGQTVVAGHYATDDLHVFVRDSSTGGIYTFATPGNPGMTQIYGVAFSHDDRNVYYTSLSGSGVVAMSRNGPLLSTTQVITHGTKYACPVPPLFFCTPGTMFGAHSVAVSPDDAYVYVGGYNDGTLTVFSRDPSTGALSLSQTITRAIEGVNVLDGAARIAVSPDGVHVYVAAAVDEGVVVFERLATGRLSFREAVNPTVSGPLADLDNPNDVALSPDGQFLYVAASGSAALNIFQRGSSDGRLTFTGVITGITGIYGVAVSPDVNGERVYVTARSGDRVTAYARNPVTGGLTLLSSHTHQGPDSNVNGPVYAAPSPDNLHVYVSLFDGQGVRLMPIIRQPPVLISLSPAYVVAGSSTFSLTVRGGRFYPDSKIVFAGTPLNTEFINENELAATVSAGQVAAVGSAAVLVRNPAPGGGDSGTLNLPIQSPNQPPIPSIESIDPPEGSFGFEELTITILGEGFVWESQVTYNGEPVPTIFFGETELHAVLSADILQAPGTGGIAVVNALPAALLEATAPDSPEAVITSRNVAFPIIPADQPALPAVTSVSPASILEETPGAWITLRGHNFTDSPTNPTQGRWNGQPRATVVLDAETLLLFATTTDLSLPGMAQVSALTLGAGESSSVALKVLVAGEKPVPVLEAVGVDTFSAPRKIIVSGADFVLGGQILLDGVPLATTFVNQYQLSATLPASTLRGIVTVLNPGPGGGLSNSLAAFAQLLFVPTVRR